MGEEKIQSQRINHCYKSKDIAWRENKNFDFATEYWQSEKDIGFDF